ncbi:MAG: hypothetical protein JXR56_06885 [Candidatus Cloacimonetes bacterium]|nr:hypothetical protein [Candidatus Cloacimonadota bacterium]
MKYLKRIVWLLTLFLVYLILKEMVILYSSLKSVNEYLAYGVFGVIAVFMVWYIVIPTIKLFAFKALFSPISNPDLIEQNMIKRNKHLRLLLNSQNVTLEEKEDPGEEYNYLLAQIQPRLNSLRQKYVSQLFISTSISQNGFLDAILILSASVNLVKDIFKIFNGRVSNRYVYIILKKVYISVAIGGSEGVEYAVEELVTKLGSDTMKSIPFLSVFMRSLTDGFVNAVLLTRVALLTENYCKLVYISTDRELFPAAKYIINTTTHIVKGSVDMFKKKGPFAEKKGNFLHKWFGKDGGEE